jgi:uncharacterized protein YdeI (YjbR/CyaY-like superfamily)
METVIAKDRAEWRRWLAKNFARREEIRLVFYKKGTGKPAVSYEHAVEEALWFGWIDGMKTAGLKAYNSGGRRETPPMPTALPKDLEDRFRKQCAAWANYEKFPPGYRRVTAGWVASAKKDDTRIKRLEKLIESSARNRRITFM